MKTLALFFALITAAIAVEESVKLPELTVGGKTYKAVTISLTTPCEAKIQHEDGSRLLDAVTLPEELRKRLGYDPEKAAVAAEVMKKDKADQDMKLAIGEIHPIRFWVSKNGKHALLVGTFKKVTRVSGGGSMATSLGRVGGGGYSPSKPNKVTTMEKDQTLAWIDHSPATRDMLVGSEFNARVVKDGTVRINGDKLVTKYKLLAIAP
ncbi:MAG: hypothetical protein V4819_19350 [Verrucomicrobiota bacterium]